jgi:hypothetical protein
MKKTFISNKPHQPFTGMDANNILIIDELLLVIIMGKL